VHDLGPQLGLSAALAQDFQRDACTGSTALLLLAPHVIWSYNLLCAADAYDPTVGGASGGFRQGRGFRHPMAHPDIERAANGPGPRTVCLALAY